MRNTVWPKCYIVATWDFDGLAGKNHANYRKFNNKGLSIFLYFGQ